MNRWRFEPMPREEAQRIHEASRRALRAIAAGESPQTSADARAMSFQAETYHDRLAAYRRLRSVTDDLTADEYRQQRAEKRARFERANGGSDE